MKKAFILILTMTAILTNTAAQDRIVEGIVTAFDNIPLYGASVKAVSTKQVILTDSTGKFSLPCPAVENIIVSANGFYRQKVQVGPGTKFAAINLKMKPGEKNRQYAIGYGTVSERDRLYAASNLTADDADFASYSNIYDLIQARFPGVQVRNGEIIIRGTQSFNSSNAALIVLNNMPVDKSVLSDIVPKEIKSIDILKDSGSSVYGSRGANGVVIIETK